MLFHKYVFASCQEKLESITSGSLHDYLYGLDVIPMYYQILFMFCTNVAFYPGSAAAGNGGGTAEPALIREYDPRGFWTRSPKKPAIDP